MARGGNSSFGQPTDYRENPPTGGLPYIASGAYVMTRSSIWARVGVVAGVVAAVVAIVAIFLTRSGQSNKAKVGGSASNCQVNGNSNTVTCDYQNKAQGAEGQTEDLILAESQKSMSIPPRGNGPWPFIVVHDFGMGLKVRTTDTPEGVQIGGIPSHHTVWAVCQQNSGFDPAPETGNGPVWLKVKWANTSPGQNFFESEISAQSTGWAYKGYVVPLGHNGQIPAC
jgi:hypothetical protein